MKMSRVAGQITYHPERMSAKEKERLITSLYTVHCEVFAGVSRATFERSIYHPGAKKTTIWIFLNAADEPVGYTAIHFFELSVNGKAYTIIRAEAGLLRDCRGGHLTLANAFLETFKYRFRHPLARLYYLGAFVHPGVYHMFGRFLKTLYPNPFSGIPGPVKNLMLKMGDAFYPPAVGSENPLIRDVGWTTRQSREEARMWLMDDDAWVRFYIEQNPNYGAGNRLLVIAPLTLCDMVRSLVRYLVGRSIHHHPGLH